MPQLGVWELLIVLVIVLLIFGASRLTGIGKGLGGAISAFRTEVKKGREDGEEEGEAPDTSKAPAPEMEPPEEQA